ncbi:MAG TPA: ATP-grasp fold amidoligase family protein, partial [Kaistiaceae bacterium]|nr:ATP-grasp fold amidoligase family protein [Kaistiaceae bacterium]
MQFQLARPNSRHKPLNDAIRLANKGFLELAIFGKFLADRRQLPLGLRQYGLYRTIHRFSLRETGRFPNLVACADINDFANWIKLFDQDPLIVQCSDKLAARDYVAAKVGPDILTRIFQIHEHFSEIDFDALPKSFVIKTNNDSGTVIIVPDKDTLDRTEAERRVERALSNVYGAAHGEWAYAHITPKVFVEESLAS